MMGHGNVHCLTLAHVDRINFRIQDSGYFRILFLATRGPVPAVPAFCLLALQP